MQKIIIVLGIFFSASSMAGETVSSRKSVSVSVSGSNAVDYSLEKACYSDICRSARDMERIKVNRVRQKVISEYNMLRPKMEGDLRKAMDLELERLELSLKVLGLIAEKSKSKILKERIRLAESQLKSLNKSADLDRQKEDFLTGCISSYSFRKNTLPEDRNLLAKKITKEVSSEVLSFMKGIYSGDSYAQLVAEFNQIISIDNVEPIESKEDFVISIRMSAVMPNYEGELGTVDSLYYDYKLHGAEKAQKKIKSFRNSHLKKGAEDFLGTFRSEDIFSRLSRKFCGPEYSAFKVNDKAVRTLGEGTSIRGELMEDKDKIYNLLLISPTSLTIPEYGKSIVAHELGHFIYAFSLKGDCKKKLKCGKKISEDSKRVIEKAVICLKDLHFGSKQHVFEDLSDLVSAKSKLNNTNYMCRLSEFTPDKYKYSLIRKNKNISHSGDFFRLLHFHQVTNDSVPQSCDKMLKVKRPELQLKSCF